MGGLDGKSYGLILLLSLLALFTMVPMAHAARNYSIYAGESMPARVSFCLTGAGTSSHVQASSGGFAGSWVSPSYFDFGDVAVGGCPIGNYTISVPAYTPSGNYTLNWYGTCQQDNGDECNSFTIPVTIRVRGIESTTTTTTINPERCLPGETMGGLPSNPFCYPSDMRVAESGSASVVDLTGAPTSSFIVGDIASTKADSSLSVSAPGYSLSLGPDTLGAMIQVMGSPTSGFSSAEDQYPSYYQTFDDQALNLGIHLSSALITHAALSQFLLLGEAGALTTTMITTPITMLEVGYGEIRLTESTLQNIGWAVKCLASASMLACPKGTDFTMTVAGNGTTISAFNGSILVASLSANGPTPKYITLNAGQQLFIPNDPTQANQQNLTSSTKTFTQSTTSTISQSTSSTLQSINITGMTETQAIVILFILVMIIVIALRLYRRRKK